MSVATVSRTFSGARHVRPEARERVMATARKPGYRPNAIARALRARNTGTLGLVIPNATNPFFTAVARAVEDTARGRGYGLVLCNSDEDPDKEAEYLEVLLEKRVDGLIVSPARAASPRPKEVTRAGGPVVFPDRYVRGADAPAVRADGRRAVDRLVGYLVSLGHGRLSIVSGQPETVPGAEGLRAFVEGAEARGVPVAPECVVVGDCRRESGARAMRELLDLSDPPTAVVAADGLVTPGALQTPHEAGVGIPSEVSVAGFDDAAWFELLAPPPTAVSRPVAELGAAAARVLPRMAEGKGRPDSLVLEAELVVRGSCARAGDGR